MEAFLELFGTVGFFWLVSYRPLAHALPSDLGLKSRRASLINFSRGTRTNICTLPPRAEKNRRSALSH